ncbi:hypothetical protein Srufu_080100 (plasmid) [Streptomyces libani subsp. rufus]|nr:hypothetical protein Srufu_080100 [Streptomyces libani subsp. rufus]
MPTPPAQLCAEPATNLPDQRTAVAPRTATTDTGGLTSNGPVYCGTGWRITSQFRTYCLSPSQQYTITFPTQEQHDRYIPFLTAAVDQLTGIGLNIAFGGVETFDYSVTPPRGHIQYGDVYRPLGTAGTSQGLPCYNRTDNSVWGGYARIDSEYWDGTWYLEDTTRKNLLIHELGHTLGLDHPNSDMNSDGTIDRFEVVKDPTGVSPTMTSPNGGYKDSRAGTYTTYDMNGFKRLLANATALGVS